MTDPDMTDELTFTILHALRLKTVATTEGLATFCAADAPGQVDLDPVVRVLEDRGLVRLRDGRRVKGWILTDEGRSRHADQLAGRDATADMGELQHAYDGFLTLNGQVKSACASWQRLPADDQGKRFEAVTELEDLHDRAQVVLEAAGDVVTRFASHERRLRHALDRLNDGEETYFTSPLVDSYHTVWFECHEDFLLTLGKDRAAEGSF